MPKFYAKQGGVALIIALTLTIVLHLTLSFTGQDIKNFSSEPLGFLRSPKGYASISIVSLWVFGVLALFLPILQSAIILDNSTDWDPEYPLYKEEFAELKAFEGINHPALVQPPAQAIVQEASSVAKVILTKKDDSKLDDIVASLEQESFKEASEENPIEKIEKKEIPPTQKQPNPNTFMNDF